MKKATFAFSLLAFVFALSCKNIGFDKTKTGLEYKIIHDGNGEKLEPGDIVKFQYKVTYNDSVVINTYNVMPAYDQVDSVGRFHDFSEFLTKMKVGDSAVCYQLFDTLAKGSPYGVPPYMKKGDKQQITIKMLAVFKNQKDGRTARDIAIIDFQNEMVKFKEKELSTIKLYIDKKQIKAELVNKNVYVQKTFEGTGPKADSGMLVGVKYSGYNFDGKYFDSNVDSTKQFQRHPLDTFYFVSKGGGAIPGMIDGVSILKKGDKATIYIPSTLAYGAQGSAPVIKPNENLIFDVEVVDVKAQPAQPAQGPAGAPQR